MSDTDSQWYYAEGSEQRGPLSADQMRSVLSAGTITRETLVWSPAMTGWQPLGQTPLAAPPPLGAGPVPSFIPPPMQASWAAPGGGAPYGAASGYGGPAAPVGLVGAVKSCFAHYATFRGRASRSEFWYFYLFSVIVLSVAGGIDGAVMSGGTSISFLASVVGLALFLPQLSVTVRRLHDTDRSGWMYWIILIPLVGIIALFVFWCQRGTPGQNRFG